MAITVDTKDPAETLDYRVDWTGELGGDTLLSSLWAVTDGTCTLGVSSIDTEGDSTFAKVWVSGGVAGESCVLTNTVVTSGGRTYEQSIVFRVMQK